MRKTIAWLVQNVLEAQLEGPCTVKGQAMLGPVMASILLRTCKARRWFDTDSTDNHERLLAKLVAADSVLPKTIRHDYPWTASDILAAAAANPELAPLLLFLFEAFGDQTAVNEESWQMGPCFLGSPIQYASEYSELVPVPEPHLQPAPRIVMLRALLLAAKVLSLLPSEHSTPPSVERLACSCLTALAGTVDQEPNNFFHNQPQRSAAEGMLQKQLCQQLVQLIGPMMSHSCEPATWHCEFCQERGYTAATVLKALLKHGDMGVADNVADAFLASGKQHCHDKFTEAWYIVDDIAAAFLSGSNFLPGYP